MGIRRSEERVRSQFRTDEFGHPTGGITEMFVNYGEGAALNRVIDIAWQDGPVENGEQNGAFIEDVLEAARQRLRYFNSMEATRCRENSLAITKIEEALQWLDWRTRQRVAQEVENTYESHES